MIPPAIWKAGKLRPRIVKIAVLKMRNIYISPPATATAMNACLWISAVVCPFVIAANIGTERSGSRMMNSAAKE